MARRRKSALNQKSETVEEKDIKVTISEKDVEKIEEMHDINIVEEAKTMASEEFDVPENNVEIEIVKEEELEEETLYVPPVPSNPDYPDKFPLETPKVKEKKEITKDDLKKLSKKGYRYYLRTGKLPIE